MISCLALTAYLLSSLVAVDTNPVFSTVYHVLSWPLSDVLATYNAATNHIYLVSGCDDPQGDVYQKEMDRIFACTSDGLFLLLDDAPRKHYQHMAANVEGKIWVLGGRRLRTK